MAWKFLQLIANPEPALEIVIDTVQMSQDFNVSPWPVVKFDGTVLVKSKSDMDAAKKVLHVTGSPALFKLTRVK